MKSNFKLRELLKNRGCYADITFEIIENNEKPSNLILDYRADKLWEIVCKAGVFIFFDYYCRQNKGELTVKIIDIKWMPIDTNNIVVFYSTIKGLGEILNFNMDKLSIDFENETFIIPETRIDNSTD